MDEAEPKLETSAHLKGGVAQQPRLRWLAAAMVAATLPVTLLLLKAPAQWSIFFAVGAGRLDREEAIQNWAASAGSWFFCPAAELCGQQAMLQWETDPVSLATFVKQDLSDLPGVDPGALAPVRQHWNEAPPHFRGVQVGLPRLAGFLKDLLASNPFATGDQVPYVDFGAMPGRGKVVALTQRQLAFVVANVLMGNRIPVGDGLSAALRRCASHPTKGIIYSLLSFLAVLSVELPLGGQGSVLVAATPRTAQPGEWRARLAGHSLSNIMVCMEGGTEHAGPCGLNDFMTGGTPFQALTDIAGEVVGGGSQLCEIANSQDESLVQFYSEVLAFAFFVGSGSQLMLPVPWVLLGARSYLREIRGEREPSGTCGTMLAQDWLNEAIPKLTTAVTVGDKQANIAASAFVAVASQAEAGCPVALAVNNRCAGQRQHLDADIAKWYQAYEASLYSNVVQQAFRTVIQRIGTGPWGAGVWWGDSQQYFLTVWLATSLLGGVSLDYYVYDRFCENPGNQCFLLGASGCTACVGRSGSGMVHANACGQRSLQDMMSMLIGKPAEALYHALVTVAQPPAQVFDVLELHQPLAAPQLAQYPGLQGRPAPTAPGTAYGVGNLLPAGMPQEVPLNAVSKAQELDHSSSTADNASTAAISAPTMAAFVAAMASCMTLAACAAVGWQWRPGKMRRYAALPPEVAKF